MQPQDVKAVNVSVSGDDKPLVSVFVSHDGLITRQGSAALDSSENTLYTGKTDDPILQRLLSKIDTRLLNKGGSYTIPVKGVPCTLKIHFEGMNENTHIEVTFGSESADLPADVYDVLMAAIEVTEDWYQAQVRAAE